MYKIEKKIKYAEGLYGMWVDAQYVAEKVEPGQFVMVMTHEKGERIPMTIADYDRSGKKIFLVFLVAGKSTAQLADMNEGDELFSLVGPLGKQSDIENYGKVVCVGGGTGIAAIHPIARSLKEAGNEVISIIGAKNKGLLFMEEDIMKVSDRVIATTDDGSYGRKGFVTDALKDLLDNDEEEDIARVWAIGPAIMMKNVALLTRGYNVKTIVSLNAIMVDATGMCGTCRVTVGEETKLTCVDGPEFDGHLVDWNEFMNRLMRYKPQEKIAMDLYMKRRQ
ncbi:MAG: sulfide/dihydroorotate dehydrogenase-like FAD/NAD-binding protein [Candidatus Thermoplasmatota archaeon]|nr:sulfide/dihydroorotate dehydrogenase-like FAD/NAD-binding protein [Candidatus Thermoplasmatota archaeon]